MVWRVDGEFQHIPPARSLAPNRTPWGRKLRLKLCFDCLFGWLLARLFVVWKKVRTAGNINMATTSETLDTAARIAGTASRRPRSQSTASPISSSLMPSSSTPLRSRRPPTRDTTHPQRRRSYPRRRVLSPLLTITTALGLAIQITAVTAQGGPTADDDPRKLICFFDNHRAIVAGDTLFVDGGEWAPKDTFRDNGTATSVVKWQSISSPPPPGLLPPPTLL